MGCVEKGRRGDGEGVEGITRAVARAKVLPVPVQNRRVFCRSRWVDICMQKGSL